MLSTIGRIPTVLSRAQYAQAAAGAPKITIQKAEPPKQEHYDDKNARLKRPLSPHLSIYEIQLTTTLSITHRTTGKFTTLYKILYYKVSLAVILSLLPLEYLTENKTKSLYITYYTDIMNCF